MPLLEVARDQNKTASASRTDQGAGTLEARPPSEEDNTSVPLSLPDEIRNEKDIEQYERLFANTAYWRRIGEEYQDPLIITGTVLFAPHSRAGVVQREVEQYDSFGRRQSVPVRSFSERKGFVLRPKFIFIDGRSGATIHSETYREEVLYSEQQSTPALSSYFELMDRLVPTFLSALSSQTLSGTRVLLR